MGWPARPSDNLITVMGDQIPRTILVVDDEELILDFVKLTLKLAGFQVLVANNPKEALALCQDQNRPIDLALLDISLPGISGAELSHSLRQILPYLPIIFMTGFADGDMERFGVADANCDLLLKPFLSRQLTEKVLEALKRVNVMSAGSKPPGQAV
jgi:two-component system, cell cycle sensor histidine kinase and response regulator CckA